MSSGREICSERIVLTLSFEGAGAGAGGEGGGAWCWWWWKCFCCFSCSCRVLVICFDIVLCCFYFFLFLLLVAVALVFFVVILPTIAHSSKRIAFYIQSLGFDGGGSEAKIPHVVASTASCPERTVASEPRRRKFPSETVALK